MRIAIFLPGLYGGGAERVMLNLASGLTQKGVAIDLLLAEEVGPYLSEVPKGVTLVPLKKKRLKFFRTISALPALVRYLKKIRPDALVSALHANIVALCAGLILGKRQKVIISEHSTFSHQTSQYPRIPKWLVRKMTHWLYPTADDIIAVSNGVADDLADKARIDRASISVIYNPVVTPELNDKMRETVNHPWFQNANPPVIMSIGRLSAEKDFGTLIRAFAKVRKQIHVRLMILGEGEDRPQLEKLVKQFNLEEDISLPGFVSNPYPFLAGASAFVLSSKWEGLPSVLIEALYCGVPIVATDCQSGPHEILKGGLYGRLVPVGDVETMAQAMYETLDRLKKEERLDESWRPYEFEVVITQYMRLITASGP